LRDEGAGEPVAKRGSPGEGSEFNGDLAATASEARGVRISEVLLSSVANEVLYQSKCESIETHLELFKKLEQQAARATRGSLVGRFHSVSMESGNSRLVIQIQPAFKLLVRSEIPTATHTT
jgi:hypothetical protein